MLRSLILAAIALAIGYAIFAWFRRRKAADHAIHATDIRAVYDALARDGIGDSWAEFHLTPPFEPERGDVTLRFALLGRRPGLEWPLSVPRNLHDRERFVRLAESRGHTVGKRQAGHVDYLRVEDGDLPLLCRKILSTLYQADSDAVLELDFQGFTWHSDDAVHIEHDAEGSRPD